jgi:formiminotetrahydrofolate cyclodeaminase
VTGFLDRPVGAFLDELAAREPVPGGGSAAAVAAAMGAGLLSMAARASRDSWPEAAGVAAQAEALRSRVEPLAQADAQAYDTALRLLEQAEAETATQGDAKLGSALVRAAAVPLQIAEAACTIAELGVLVAERADPRLRPDVAAAVILAAAATEIGAHLVGANLATQPDDARVARAGELVMTAKRAVESVLGPA